MKKYFLYSASYVKDTNSILEARGKELVLGTVVVDGKKKEFAILSNTSSIFNYSDVRVVAYSDINKIKYTAPSYKKKNSIV